MSDISRSDPAEVAGPHTLSDGTAVVEAFGELDLAGAPRLEAALDAAERGFPPVLRVDASRVTFIDSTALSVLLHAAQRASERGGRLQLVCHSPAIRRVLEMTMIDRTIEVVD